MASEDKEIEQKIPPTSKASKIPLLADLDNKFL
jgi:hypothetical protein